MAAPKAAALPLGDASMSPAAVRRRVRPGQGNREYTISPVAGKVTVGEPTARGSADVRVVPWLVRRRERSGEPVACGEDRGAQLLEPAAGDPVGADRAGR